MAIMQTDLKEQHLILPYIMLLTGAAALVRNAYELKFQLLIFLATGLVTVLYLLLNKKNPPKLPVMIFLPVIGFLAWGTLSLIWSINPGNTVWDLLRLSTYVLTFTLIVLSFRAKEVKKIYNYLIFLGMLVALFGIASYLFLDANRIESTFINANPLGIFLGMMLLLTLARYLVNGGSCLYGLAAVLIGTGLLLSFSRGSLLAVGVGLVLLLTGVGKAGIKNSLVKLLALTALTVILTAGIMQLAPYFQKAGLLNTSFSSSLIRAESFASVSVGGRWAFWQVAARMFLDRPWTGMGLGNYSEGYMAFYGGTSFYSKYVHNHYLQTAAELGWPGILLFLLIILAFVYRWIRCRKKTEFVELYYGAGAAALAFLAHIFIDFSWDMPAVTLVFWILLALLTVLQGEKLQTREIFVFKPLAIMAALLVIPSILLGTGDYFAEQGAREMQAGRPAKANANFALAVRLVPWEPRYYSYLAGNLKTLAETESNQKLLNEALEMSRKAAGLSPFDAQYLYQTGYLAWQTGDVGSAEKYYQQAIKKAGFKLQPYIYLGEFYLFQKKWSKAEEIYQQAAALYPKAIAYAPQERITGIQAMQSDLLLGLAQAQIALNKEESAKKALQQALQLRPENKQAETLLKKL